nr:hypothetical protein [Rhizobium tibeticum]
MEKDNGRISPQGSIRGRRGSRPTRPPQQHVGIDRRKDILREIDRFQFGEIAVSVGIALHHGEVSYGNIGSSRRLDFTLIGPDVNRVTASIQRACGDLRVPLLMSDAFRKEAQAEAVSAGWQTLTGFPQKVELFRLPEA